MQRLLCVAFALFGAHAVSGQSLLTPRMVQGFYAQDSTLRQQGGSVLSFMARAHGMVRDHQPDDFGAPITPEALLARPSQGASQTWEFHFRGHPNLGIGPIFNLANEVACPILGGTNPQIFSRGVGPLVDWGGGTIFVKPLGIMGVDTSRGQIFLQQPDGYYLLRDFSTRTVSAYFLNPIPYLIPSMRLGERRTTESGFVYTTGPVCWPPVGPYVPIYDTLEVSGQGLLLVNHGPAQPALLVEHRRHVTRGGTMGLPMPNSVPVYARTFDFLAIPSGSSLLSYTAVSTYDSTTQRWSALRTEAAHWSATRYPAASPLATRPSAARWSLGLNPVKTTLMVQGLRPGPVSILNTQGQRWQVVPQAGQVDVSALTPGVYVLEADGQRARFVKE